MLRLIAPLIITSLLAACSTSTLVVSTTEGTSSSASVDSIIVLDDYVPIDYSTVRAKANDPLPSVVNPYPAEYKTTRTGSSARTSRQGYRVQLLSTQVRMEAEVMLENYTIWLASQRFSHPPKGYVQFKAPFFRVHIGDFYERNDALQLVKRLKNQFPDAWVVADTIDPEEAGKY